LDDFADTFPPNLFYKFCMTCNGITALLYRKQVNKMQWSGSRSFFCITSLRQLYEALHKFTDHGDSLDQWLYAELPVTEELNCKDTSEPKKERSGIIYMPPLFQTPSNKYCLKK